MMDIDCEVFYEHDIFFILTLTKINLDITIVSNSPPGSQLINKTYDLILSYLEFLFARFTKSLKPCRTRVIKLSKSKHQGFAVFANCCNQQIMKI